MLRYVLIDLDRIAFMFNSGTFWFESADIRGLIAARAAGGTAATGAAGGTA